MNIKLLPAVTITLAMTVLLSPAALVANNEVAKHSTPRVMLVVSSADGKVIRQGDNYLLKLPLNSIQQTLSFTEQPYRIVKYMNRKDLKQAWYSKTYVNNFAHNPPNAVLASQHHPVVVTVEGMYLHGHSVAFLYRPIKPGMFHMPDGSVKQVVLTIDDAIDDGSDVMNALRQEADSTSTATTASSDVGGATSTVSSASNADEVYMQNVMDALRQEADETVGSGTSTASTASADVDVEGAGATSTASSASDADDGSDVMAAIREVADNEAAAALPEAGATVGGEAGAVSETAVEGITSIL